MFDRYISTHFGKLHGNFAKEVKLVSRVFAKNFRKYLPEDKNVRIADLACGMGHFLYFLREHGYQGLGVDISHENVEFCKEQGFDVIEDDLVHFLENNQEPFDVIAMSDILEHLEHDTVIKVLELVHKNLVPGGKIFLMVPNMSNPILGSNTLSDDFTHRLGFTELSLSQVLKVTNFKNIKIFGQKIYIFKYNPINYLAQFAAYILSIWWRLLFILYGRTTTKIFTKSLIGIAEK